MLCCYEDNEQGSCGVQVPKRCLDDCGKDNGEFVIRVPVKEVSRERIDDMKETCCANNNQGAEEDAPGPMKKLAEFFFVGAPWARDDEPECEDIFRPLSPICCMSPQPEADNEPAVDPCNSCNPPQPHERHCQ
jgi:hypothetical protein